MNCDVSTHLLKGLSAPRPAESRRVHTLWFTSSPSMWYVLELVRILELRQNINLIRFLPYLKQAPRFAQQQTLRPPGSGVRIEWAAQCWLCTQGNLGKHLRAGKDIVQVTGRPVDTRPQQGLLLREEEDSRTTTATNRVCVRDT